MTITKTIAAAVAFTSIWSASVMAQQIDQQHAVVRWLMLNNGASVYSAPLPYREALRVYHHDRSFGPPSGALSASVFLEGTPEFDAAIAQQESNK